MNQILVTEKIYVTPELRRKKKIYRFLFILSILLIMILCSAYIYAEYDRNRDESISKDILSFLQTSDDTTISSYENALVVLLTEEPAQEVTDEQQENTMKSVAATKTYTASDGQKYEAIGFVRIPKIGVDYPILEDSTDALLKVSVCKFHGSNPNEVGNLCIVGHNYRNSKFFSKVPTLSVGDIVEIEDLSKRTLQYEVYDIHTVDPKDRKDTTQYTNGKKEVTLITCTNDSKQRYIVKCTEKT
jgi:LPXTG-site transpeptidase (sortase) family protein